ncbi:MAG TPA: hypothetical protein VGG18_16485 [Granulicella sp.]|jgi:hypothetical protein
MKLACTPLLSLSLLLPALSAVQKPAQDLSVASTSPGAVPVLRFTPGQTPTQVQAASPGVEFRIYPNEGEFTIGREVQTPVLLQYRENNCELGLSIEAGKPDDLLLAGPRPGGTLEGLGIEHWRQHLSAAETIRQISSFRSLARRSGWVWDRRVWPTPLKALPEMLRSAVLTDLGAFRCGSKELILDGGVDGTPLGYQNPHRPDRQLYYLTISITLPLSSR